MSSLLSYYWVIEFVAAIVVMAVGLNEPTREPFNTNKKCIFRYSMVPMSINTHLS
jgi:hypothetical protein